MAATGHDFVDMIDAFHGRTFDVMLVFVFDSCLALV